MSKKTLVVASMVILAAVAIGGCIKKTLAGDYPW